MKCPNCSLIIYWNRERKDWYEKRENKFHRHRCYKDRCEYIVENELGYRSIRMYNGEVTYWRSIHKVVMEIQLTKLNGIRTIIHPSLQVHHKDRNPRNNSISNLQIVSAKEHKQIHYQLKREMFEKAYAEFLAARKMMTALAA